VTTLVNSTAVLSVFAYSAHPNALARGVILITAKDRKDCRRTAKTSRKTAQDPKELQGHLIRRHCCMMIVIACRRAVVYVGDTAGHSANKTM